jgi:Spy/CpxP family protein refolding chaperone
MKEVPAMKRAAVFTFLSVLSLLASPAQSKTIPQSTSSTEPCPPPPAVVAAFLGFSPAQIEQFGTLLTQFQTNVHSLQEQIAPRQQQLDALLSQPNPNPAQVGVLVVQIHALQQQVAQVIQAYQTAFVGLLTPDQKQKIEQVTLASQLQTAVGAFVALYLVPPPSLPCQKQ